MKPIDSPIKKNLTPSQEDALCITSPVCVEAGAGSGKTSVLVERYLKILRTHPELTIDQIIAFTFTKKAAAELLDRIQKNLPNASLNETLHLANISTIHTFAGKLLRKFPIEADLDPEFTVLDQTQCHLIKKNAVDLTLYQLSKTNSQDLKNYLKQYTLRQLKSHLASLLQKNSSPPSEEDLPEETHLLKTLFIHCKNTYNHIKKTQAFLDYDDLILRSNHLLTHHPAVQKEVQGHHKFIMVDEFQDTDPTQWELILKLSQNEDPTKNSNLFLVGDTKQSIYSFRGSDPRIFQEGLRYIQENAGKIISLADNFRTQKPVLDILNPFFENLFSHNYTPLIPYRTETTGTVTTYIPKEETEATHIANWIEEKLKTHPEFHPHDIAILSRTKTQMDTLQYTLTQKGLKSNILSKPSYYQREEIIVLFNLIKGLLNPEDNLAWKRILIDPLFFHIPENIIAEIYPNHPTLSLLEKCALSNDPVLLSALTEIKKWTSILPLYPLHHVINLILTESNFWYKLASQDNGPKKIQNINMLITKITEYENDAIISSLDILDLIQNAIESNAIESENEAAFKNDHIAILSIHAAKGLEFPIVIISECGKTFNLSKSTPHVLRPLQPTDETAIIEEEKRIFYVACTRAKDHLHLVGKQKETQKNAPSYLKFLTELLPNKNQTSAQLKIS